MKRSSHMSPLRRLSRLGVGMVMVCALAGLAAHGAAPPDSRPASEAPEISLRDFNGAEVTTSSLRGRVLVVIFGELYHERTRHACNMVDEILRDPRLSGETITPILVVTQQPKGEDMKTYAKDKLPALILLDGSRKAFGAYEVAVMPSAVVIDKQGRLVHTAAGLMSRSTDILTGSLLLAAGKISATRFQETLNPQPTTAASDATVRAERLTQLARQLARRHLEEMAAEKYAEAIKLDPHQMDAHLEMGKLLLKRRGLAEAEKHFRLVLANQPGSVEGVLGLAFVQMLRGGGETDEAERAVRTVLAKNDSQPRAHYLLGLILERRGQMDRAAASFKRAADLLMERSEQE